VNKIKIFLKLLWNAREAKFINWLAMTANLLKLRQQRSKLLF